MRIPDLYGAGKPVISFEFFPPKTERGYLSLFRTIADLQELHPGFVSVTMGAGGSTRRKTVGLVTQIQRELRLAAMAHLPCVGFERAEVAEGRVVSQAEAFKRAREAVERVAADG